MTGEVLSLPPNADLGGLRAAATAMLNFGGADGSDLLDGIDGEKCSEDERLVMIQVGRPRAHLRTMLGLGCCCADSRSCAVFLLWRFVRTGQQIVLHPQTLLRIFGNILESPEDATFRSVRMTNDKVQQKVGPLHPPPRAPPSHRRPPRRCTRIAQRSYSFPQ